MKMNVPRNTILLVLLGVAILVCICGIGISTLFFLLPQPNDNYAVIFDAGAYDTNMYIYKYNGNYQRVDDLSIQQIKSCQTNDSGIASINNSTLFSSFSTCLAIAGLTVPDNKKNTTPIVLKGTEGMRLLGISSSNTTDYVYDSISSLLEQSGFQIRNDSVPSTLKGTDEALLTWISTNYALNTLVKVQSNTVGILDLGDNSVQISFGVLTQGSNDSNQSTYQNVSLFGNSFNSYSDSYMCFGQSQAILMYFNQLLNTSDAQGNVATACLPSGYNISLPRTAFTSSPCTNGIVFNTTSQVLNQASYTFYGASNYTSCTSQIQRLLFTFPFCYGGENGCSQSTPNTSAIQFIGLSNIWTTWSLRNSLISTTQNVTNSTQYLCSLNSSQINNLNLSVSQDQLANACFSTIYIDQMTSLLGLSSLNPQRSVNGLDIVWPLGYLVDQLSKENYKQERPDSRAMPYFAYVITVVMLGLFIFIILFLFVYYVCSNRRRSSAKLPEPAIDLEAKNDSNI